MNKSLEELLPQIQDSERYDQEALRSDISDQILCLMKAQGVTKTELARRLSTSKAYVTKILQGNANFTLDTLVQIARALGCRYVARLAPLDIWKQREAVQFSAPTKGANPSQSYRPRMSVEAKAEIK
jgi:transcriptional regulator with XRE-family HTH domain